MRCAASRANLLRHIAVIFYLRSENISLENLRNEECTGIVFWSENALWTADANFTPNLRGSGINQTGCVPSVSRFLDVSHRHTVHTIQHAIETACDLVPSTTGTAKKLDLFTVFLFGAPFSLPPSCCDRIMGGRLIFLHSSFV